MIFNMMGGGGGGLAFTVKAYETLPETGRENNIAVISTIPVNGYVFDKTPPASPKNGAVWIDSSGSSISFAATKDGSIILYPKACKQWDGNTWIACNAYIFQSGVWVQFATQNLYIYNAGTEYYEFTSVGKKQDSNHGVAKAPTVTKNEDSMKISLASTEWYSGIVYATTPIDLTDYTSAHVTYNSYTNQGEGDKIRLAAYTSIGTYLWSNDVAEVTLSDEATEAAMDITALTGEHIIGLGVQNHSNSSGTMSINVTSIQLGHDVLSDTEGGSGGESVVETSAGTNSIDVASKTLRYTTGNTTYPWEAAQFYDTASPTENYVGHKSGETNTMLIPVGSFSFAGTSTKLRLTFTGYCPSTNFASKGFRWAICSSKANKTMYQGQSAVTGDEYQLASGIGKFAYNSGSYTTYTVDMAADNLPSDTELYVFCWPNGTTTDVAHIKDTVKASLYYIAQ